MPARALAAVAAAVLMASGCAADAPARTPDRVAVFADSSLTEPFQQMATEIEADRPGLDIVLRFGGSTSLVPEVVSGDSADVFATANPDTMQLVVDRTAIADDPEVFARNRLQIAVPVGNAVGVEDLKDLADPELELALCAPEVPCGVAAQKALQSGSVVAEPDSFEEDVKAVLSKVLLGEADAGLIYRTDVLAAGGQVDGLDFAESERSIDDYTIAPLTKAPNPAGGRIFLDFVRSERGREILRRAGFDVP